MFFTAAIFKSAFSRALPAAVLAATTYTLPLPAQDRNAGALAPREYMAGFIRLYDGYSTAGWESPDGGLWVSEKHELTSPEKGGSVLQTTSTFGDFELEFEYNLEASGAADIAVRCPYLRKGQPHDAYVVKLMNPTAAATGWARLRIRAQSANVAVFSLGSDHTISNESKFEAGRIVLAPVKGRLSVRNLRLQPINTRRLFDGASLTGWSSAVPGQAKFEALAGGVVVGKSGEIQHRVDRPEYVIQADVKADSARASGGIRIWETEGRPDSGVEVHINNLWHDIDRTKPFDFGTGGIYRHQPAREILTADREWCELTIAVTVNHVDVWVNGYYEAGYSRPAVPTTPPPIVKPPPADSIALAVTGAISEISFRNVRLTPPPEPIAK